MAPPPEPVSAYIALGSNLGDRAANLRRAIDLLGTTPGVAVTTVSSFLDNPSVGGPTGSPPYLNAAAAADTTLPPDQLLRRLLTIEREMGRVRRRKWEPRVIDLDLLLYDDVICHTPELTLPHPLLHERDFVLQPLAEVGGDAMHPVLKRTVAQLLADLGARRTDPAALLTDHDLPCSRCGYNLRGLTAAHDCPECGTPAMETLKQAARGQLRGATRDAAFYRTALLAPVADAAGATVDGVLFVMDALAMATPSETTGSTGAVQLTAVEICRGVHAYVHAYFNDAEEARDLLAEWKVPTSEDVGRIVFALAGAGIIKAPAASTLRDFDNRFTLDALMIEPETR